MNLFGLKGFFVYISLNIKYDVVVFWIDDMLEFMLS